MTMALAVAVVYAAILGPFFVFLLRLHRETEQQRQWCRERNEAAERLRKECLARGERDPRKWASPRWAMSDEI